MYLLDLLRSKKIFVCILIVFAFSVFLLFLPLIGALGYEFSIIIAFLISFISVFTSAEILNDFKKSTFVSSGVEDVLFSALIINFIIILPAFLLGFIGSWFNGFCNFQDGLIFFILLPVISLIFSTAIGSFSGLFFGNRGFIIGAIVLIFILLFSLLQLYNNPHIFFYNSIIGYFPGPIYDKIIPITTTLIIYRIYILACGLFILKISALFFGKSHSKLNLQNIILLSLLLVFILICFTNKQRLGFAYSRDYITKNYLNKTIETENFVIHYSPYSRFSDNIQLIAEDHEWRYKQLKSFLDVEISEKIHSYIYADNELRKKMIGAGDTTIADPVHREIHIVYNSFPQNVLKHELVHVMSSEFGTRLLKISPKVGLIEGLAVAADWDIKGIDRHQWARSMIDQGIAPNVEDIIGIGFWYAPGPKSYTIMGSFCRFLIDTYGIEKFKYFYKTGNAKVYDKTLGELVNSWKEYLFKITISENTKKLVVYKFSDKGIFGEYCPREVEYYKEKGLKSYRNNDIAMASTFFNKARNIDVSNPELLALLAHSRYYEKEYDEIIRLLEFRDDFSITDINILKNLEANVLWQRGDYENALNIFTALRDKSLPDDVLRELDIKIYLEMFDQGLNDLLKSYYGTNDSFNKLDILNNIIHSYPKFSPAYYLKGRIHFKRNEYERASKYFSDADLMLLPTNKLQIDNMLLLGISLYVSKDYQQSINIFEKIILSDDKGSLKDYATDFIKRCEWAMELL